MGTFGRAAAFPARVPLPRLLAPDGWFPRRPGRGQEADLRSSSAVMGQTGIEASALLQA